MPLNPTNQPKNLKLLSFTFWNLFDYRHAATEGMDSYQQALDHMEIRPDR